MTSENPRHIDLLHPVFEAVVLTLASSVLTQGFAAYKEKDLFAFDLVQIFHFVLYAAITTPPNYLFQLRLENSFPTRAIVDSKQDGTATKQRSAETAKQHGRLNIGNTLIKFALDQTIAATGNTGLYIVLMGSIRGHSYEHILSNLSEDFVPLLLANYRFWPFVCLLNFGLVPMQYRPYVGSAAGLAWGFWLGLREKSGI